MRLDALGAEFFRWEFATAVAGAVLRINPFDEPNVSEAKEKTKALLQAYAESHELPEPAIAAEDDSVSIISRRFAGATPAAIVRQAIDSLESGDYVAILSYLPASSDVRDAITEVRQGIRARTRAASTFGIGPGTFTQPGSITRAGRIRLSPSSSRRTTRRARRFLTRDTPSRC